VVSATELTRVLQLDEPADEDAVRERILAAALEQFRLVGLRRTTVGDVARRAGVGRVTVYRRVGHKPELVAAAIQSEVKLVIARVASAITALDTVEERLVEAFVVGLGIVRSHPLLRRLLETEPEDLLPYLTLEFGQMLELARQFVTREITIGTRPADAEVVAELLTRLAQSLVLTPEGTIPVNDERRLRKFARSYLTALLSA
jgi:AcrR family transcriptional regulator